MNGLFMFFSKNADMDEKRHWKPAHWHSSHLIKFRSVGSRDSTLGAAPQAPGQPLTPLGLNILVGGGARFSLLPLMTI